MNLQTNDDGSLFHPKSFSVDICLFIGNIRTEYLLTWHSYWNLIWHLCPCLKQLSKDMIYTIQFVFMGYILGDIDLPYYISHVATLEILRHKHILVDWWTTFGKINYGVWQDHLDIIQHIDRRSERKNERDADVTDFPPLCRSDWQHQHIGLIGFHAVLRRREQRVRREGGR